MAAGGGRVEVERRDEEEGGEGDTDSQADRWVSIHRHHLTQLTTLLCMTDSFILRHILSHNTTYHFQLTGKTVKTRGRQEEEERVQGRMEMEIRIMKPPPAKSPETSHLTASGITCRRRFAVRVGMGLQPLLQR